MRKLWKGILCELPGFFYEETYKNRGSSEAIGVLVTLERFMSEADENMNQFLNGFLNKQHTRLKGVFDRHIVHHLSISFYSISF